uniref:Suppressor of lurcher protein 1 n=1 Tax=Bursaphelenchus xylophilus TaxID=6326 RepID=A0A1I7RXZ8_BURXY
MALAETKLSKRGPSETGLKWKSKAKEEAVSFHVHLRHRETQCPVRILSKNVQGQYVQGQLVEDLHENEGSRVNPEGGNFGLIISSHYYSTSMASYRCQFLFLGAPDEHVQISFIDFHLSDANTSKRCEEGTHLSIHVLVGSRMSKVQDFCGKELPAPLISTQNLLTMELNVRDIPLPIPASMGFKLKYSFMKGYGRQYNDGASVKSTGDCSFAFYGDNATAGQVWSPNHPGFYPRNLDCEYTFNGQPGQIVVIHFQYFDVEGYGQCEDTTHSDFVLFSNYKTVDRTNRRFCGSNRPPKDPIQSESSYFRMQFKTNDIFDATGFYVYYQFLNQQHSTKNRVKLVSNSHAQLHFSIPTLLICSTIISLTNKFNK